jgi:hypothetical protein
MSTDATDQWLDLSGSRYVLHVRRDNLRLQQRLAFQLPIATGAVPGSIFWTVLCVLHRPMRFLPSNQSAIGAGFRAQHERQSSSSGTGREESSRRDVMSHAIREKEMPPWIGWMPRHAGL